MTSAAAIVSLLTPAAQPAAGRGAVEVTDPAQGDVFAALLNQMQIETEAQAPLPQPGDTATARLLKPQPNMAVQGPDAALMTPASVKAPLSMVASQVTPEPTPETPEAKGPDTASQTDLTVDTSALALFSAFVMPQSRTTQAPQTALTTSPQAAAGAIGMNGAPVPWAGNDTPLPDTIELTTALPAQDDAGAQALPASITAQLAAATTNPTATAAIQTKPSSRPPSLDATTPSPSDQSQATTSLLTADMRSDPTAPPHARVMPDPTATPGQTSAGTTVETSGSVDPLTAATPQAAQSTLTVDLKQVAHTPLPTTAPIPVPLDALAVQIARKVEQGLNQFEITLTPAELGKLDISLKITDDGRVQAVLRAERQETLDLLRQDARTLESQLRQAGLDVNAGALSFQLSQGNAHRYQRDNGGFANAMTPDNDDSARDVTATAWIATRKRDGIDIHV
jgi:flagellar hook-length control protein FliK